MPNLVVSSIPVVDQNTLMSFIDEMLNSDSITPSEKSQKKTEIMRDLNAKVSTHIVSMLSAADSKELKELVDDEAPDDFIHDFLEEKIPNLESEIALVMVSYKNNFAHNAPLN